jgi:opacity protein-like surface antigen
MKTRLLASVGVLVSLAAGVGAAFAADMAPVYKAPAYKAPPVIISDWAGFYLGVHGGYGWGDSNLANFADFGLPFSQKGGLFGGHAGYNWQHGAVVTGLEIDFDGANIKDTNAIIADDFTATATAKTTELASARARLGYTLWPNLLAYGTAGAGWAHTNFHVTNTNDDGTSSFDTGVNQFGWVAGAGLEYKFYGNWIARAEYLHYDFDKTATDLGPFSQTINVVRGGLSYKF